jgi:hypothetical protein
VQAKECVCSGSLPRPMRRQCVVPHSTQETYCLTITEVSSHFYWFIVEPDDGDHII